MSAPVRAAGGGRKSKDALQSVGDPGLTRVAPPDELRDEFAVQIWKSQSKLMIQRGTLSREDLPILMAYCNSFSYMLEADREITDNGFYTITADGGKKKHPAVNVRNDSVSQLKMLGSMLGLDPLSRSRVIGGGATKPNEDGNPFDEF
ncbi:phage terminase small subunit P27 family [Sansalvadorimonas verongulae]|uniref:phage terminase small subunit P27 family n=1 Tax=Sansalvadorimonas verongulae TaxID=2172824 RepID=UPI0012BC1ED5|nr:phage terminase small subunit P27 family [Sansalvadorimonas verongulae]MTI12642.1 phage terminase small subunit P27 family [Sansalvadorimonas verongulae]